MSESRTVLGVLVLYLLCTLLLLGCGDDAPKAIRIGDIAPVFEAKNLQGQKVSLDDYRGKPVVIRFFLPDCKFCRADTPVFNDFYRTYQEKGLGILYVNTDPKEGAIQKFVDELNILFPVLLDPKHTVADKYKVQVVPQTVVLNPEHKVIGAILGGVSKEELDGHLGVFLK